MSFDTRPHILPTVFSGALVALLLWAPGATQAEVRVIVADSIYVMGDGETPIFAEAMCLQKAKQAALEQAGTYVESYTHVRNLDVTVDEIKTIAGGILETEVIQKDRTLLKDGGERFYTKIRARITTDRIEDLARRIKTGGAVDENKRVLDTYARLDKELEMFKRQITETKTDNERELALDRIREVEKQFRQVRSTELALFKRIVSGDELSEQVNKALLAKQKQKEEEQKRRDWQDRAVKNVLDLLQNDGLTVLIEPPQTEVYLDQPERVTLGFPVTVKVSDQFKQTLSDLVKSYSGDVPVAVESQIEGILKRLTLSLLLSLSNGQEYTSDNYELHFKSPRSYDLKSVFREGPSRSFVQIEIPRSFVPHVRSVEGRIAMK
ncbi:MAG: hypothetical protein H8K08_06665 [Nitrospira sp.]|nr:hypothetical protein [Nitrospira sp.]